jgi:hypothetical protein
MKRLLSMAGIAALLSGCTTFPTGACLAGCVGVPVGSVALCIGVCKIEIKPASPQSAAEKAGAAAGGLLQDLFQSTGRR